MMERVKGFNSWVRILNHGFDDNCKLVVYFTVLCEYDQDVHG